MDSTLRIGLFPYLNVQPIVFGLRNDVDVEMVIDLPSRIANLFREGALDLAMVPSFEAASMNAPVLDSVCIASDGPVETVLLHHRVPLNRVRTLSLDEASRTSAALAKILIAQASGSLPLTEVFSPFSSEVPDTDAVLVIGDPAFRFVAPGFECLDLGEVWQREHALPFVFAVMVAGPKANRSGIAARLAQATERGCEAAHFIAGSYTSGVDPARAEHYLRSVIHYQLGRREKDGLAMFHRLARTHGLLNQVKELEFHAF